jgi:hypothetical protein
MKLYHGTKTNYLQNILDQGLVAEVSSKISHNVRLNVSCVYGFDTLQAAQDFMLYDNNENHYSIVSFDVRDADVVRDTEYDNGAYAVACEKIEASKLTVEISE